MTSAAPAGRPLILRPTPHPAKYSDVLLGPMAAPLVDSRRIIDSMCGTGKAGLLKLHGLRPGVIIHGNDLEREWLIQGFANGMDVLSLGDARSLPYPDAYFDGACISPCYGNRMADHCEWLDDSVRNTYKAKLGRALTAGNGGSMRWGDAYRDLHTAAWRELARVLMPGAVFVLNISDHRDLGVLVPVTQWHLNTIEASGFYLCYRQTVVTPRNRFGANGQDRIEGETLLVFRRRDDRAAA